MLCFLVLASWTSEFDGRRPPLQKEAREPTGIGDSADFLASSTVRAQMTGNPPRELTGVFSPNHEVRGYQVFDGYGLIDAYAAARAVQSAHGHH